MTAKEERYQKFSDDMDDAGYIVTEYKGRNFYSGSSVRVDESELQDVIRATTVSVQWDTLGKSGLIVYPK